MPVKFQILGLGAPAFVALISILPVPLLSPYSGFHLFSLVFSPFYPLGGDWLVHALIIVIPGT